jgi:hypothetical protein
LSSEENDAKDDEDEMDDNSKVIFRKGDSAYCDSFVTATTSECQKKLNLGLKLNNPFGQNKTPLRLGIQKNPSFASTAHKSSGSISDKFNPQLYESALANLVKLHHRKNHTVNQLSIHKIMISSQKVDLDFSMKGTGGSSGQQNNTIKYDLKMDS